MPGARQADFRMGDRTELLVQFCLNAIAFTTPVPRQEDVGHDFLCALAEPHGDMLWAGQSFMVQAKSNTKPLIFEKPHELAWLRGQENPFLIAVGHKADLRVDIYSTWQRVSAAMQHAASRIVLNFAEPPSGDGEVVLSLDKTSQEIYLRKPIVSFTVSDLLNRAKADALRDVLRHWILVDRDNIASRHIDVHWVVGPARYNTNELPPSDAFQLALFWHAKNLDICARNLGRAAAALRLTLEAAGASATDSERTKLDALDTVLRAWSDVLDPAAKDALADRAGLVLQ